MGYEPIFPGAGTLSFDKQKQSLRDSLFLRQFAPGKNCLFLVNIS